MSQETINTCELVNQLALLVEQLFQETEAISLKESYYYQMHQIIQDLKRSEDSASPFMMDKIPHPKVHKLMVQSKIYYLDQTGHIYEQDSKNSNMAKLVGGFRGMAFDIAGQIFPVKSRQVEIIPNRNDRLFVDAGKKVYDPAFHIVNPNGQKTQVGSLTGYFDNMGQIRLNGI